MAKIYHQLGLNSFKKIKD